MWVYEQLSGRTLDPDGNVVAFGYSGKGYGKNNPIMQNISDTGPIPAGYYIIGPPEDTVAHGPFVLPLTPDPGNEMFCRDKFLIHGDNVHKPGAASEGCIILPHWVREQIARSSDRILQVVSGVGRDKPAKV